MKFQTEYEFRGMHVRKDILLSIYRWVIDGLEPGSFLMAVLENNLKEAFARADEENAATLHAIVTYCYNEIPGNCWGSVDKVTEWGEMRARTREEDAAAAEVDE